MRKHANGTLATHAHTLQQRDCSDHTGTHTPPQSGAWEGMAPVLLSDQRALCICLFSPAPSPDLLRRPTIYNSRRRVTASGGAAPSSAGAVPEPSETPRSLLPNPSCGLSTRQPLQAPARAFCTEATSLATAARHRHRRPAGMAPVPVPREPLAAPAVVVASVGEAGAGLGSLAGGQRAPRRSLTHRAPPVSHLPRAEARTAPATAVTPASTRRMMTAIATHRPRTGNLDVPVEDRPDHAHHHMPTNPVPMLTRTMKRARRVGAASCQSRTTALVGARAPLLRLLHAHPTSLPCGRAQARSRLLAPWPTACRLPSVEMTQATIA